MTEIDWTKPIELMDGEPRDHSWPCQYDVWIHGYDGANGFWVNRSGCIGGVQVVRNRKEPEKHLHYVFWNKLDRGVQIYSDKQAPIAGKNQLAKILIWCDENGKTRVEACDD